MEMKFLPEYDFPTLPVITNRPYLDYIDYIYPEDMTAPVMRYRDMHGRNAILFRIQVNIRYELLSELEQKEVGEYVKFFWDKRDKLIWERNAKTYVMVYFQKYIKDSKIFSQAWGHSDHWPLTFFIADSLAPERTFQKKWIKTDYQTEVPDWLHELVAGTHPLFQLV